MTTRRARTMAPALLLALVLGVAARGQSDLEVRLRPGQTRKVDVGRAVGLNCDDLDVVEARLVTSKDRTHNVLVLKGKTEGTTDCRAGQPVLGATVLVHIVVEEPLD